MILPLSAIGLNISVYKCKHKGTIHFAFFEFPKNLSHSDCCCSSSCDMSSLTNEQKKSSCNHKPDHKQNNDCLEPNMSCMTENNSDTCSMKADEQSQENISKDSYNQESTKSTISYQNKSCCSDSTLSFAVDFNYISLDNNKQLIKFPILFNNMFQKLNFCILSFDKLYLKILKYPLKEPICKIISFIHFNSLSGDDTVAPLFL